MIKLFFALFWLIAGVYFLLLEQQRAAAGMAPTTPFPLSWLAFAMALFNALRWWGGRFWRRAKQPDDSPTAPPRRSRHPEPPEDEPRAPNPDFQFDHHPDSPESHK